ncbi:type II toxin-antitoxin system ParD family antitoxin [Serratia sarumanii]|uniref:type II toxin-antitoxin system ParD family antitoxin n=1 Tax=Serratia sarumanii TaxID=3020826 RepID=UPI003F7EBF1C
MNGIICIMLGANNTDFVDEMTQSAQYVKRPGVFCKTLRLMEAREQRIQDVREKILAGVNGPVSDRPLEDIFTAAAKDVNADTGL